MPLLRPGYSTRRCLVWHPGVTAARRSGRIACYSSFKVTEDTTCDSIDDIPPMAQQIFKDISPSARCLLGDPTARATLVEYCDFKEIMQYRLDKERTLVFVSAITCATPGSANAAAAPEAPCVVAVENMQKVSKDDAAYWTAERKSVPNAPETLCKRECWSSDNPTYWTPESASKARRVQFAPMSPGPSSG